ncbi:MAG TPA: hypothetical protein VJ508_01440 [Saprospiraceae bacterium]|nr:hypothetical protein [Saprospiraceae bacterium]
MNRLKYGWTWMRVIYLLLGLAITIQSAADHEWVILFFGLYFTAMGVFGFGCAAGVCMPEYPKRPVENQNPE